MSAAVDNNAAIERNDELSLDSENQEQLAGVVPVAPESEQDSSVPYYRPVRSPYYGGYYGGYPSYGGYYRSGYYGGYPSYGYGHHHGGYPSHWGGHGGYRGYYGRHYY